MIKNYKNLTEEQYRVTQNMVQNLLFQELIGTKKMMGTITVFVVELLYSQVKLNLILIQAGHLFLSLHQKM